MSAPDRRGTAAGTGPDPGSHPGPDPDRDPAAGSADLAPATIEGTIEELSRPVLVPAQRRGLVRALARRTGAASRWRPRAAVRWTVDTVQELAPHVPVRDLATLSRHHDGLTGDALAQRLIRNAARASAGVGAASGSLAAVKWTVPPTLLTAPVLLGAETVAVVSIELKLVGELHAAYGVPVPGEGPGKAVALLRSWAQQRGVTTLPPTIGVATMLGTAARKELTDRLVRRFGTNLTTLAPMLVGASVAAYLNRRATRALGDQLRSDLRGGGGLLAGSAGPAPRQLTG